ncbi:phosphatase PAP2 family protein [Rhodovulum tesquicola]|uniref:phosphatase PAP2 family protein n=1 Tax=Rhodovulum tesquicola TaxID=540254 RepID=UPI00209744A2|nr:phosphatase PAP2 family protein [Rhodovulum tesquicola]MCO8145740.1 phosphatase PAP2 family protein [Rhodovulum tesquicola]
MRHLALLGMLAIVSLVVVLSDRQAQLIGDRLQVVLPLAGLACAIAQGDGVRYTGRYLLLESAIKGPKFGLGDAPINQRPSGGGHGFPSGHTAAASFGATALVMGCLRDSPGAQALAVLSAGFVGGSRIDAGKHTIWQTLAGAVLGYAVAVLKLGAFDRAFRGLWLRAVTPVLRGVRRRARRWRRRGAILALSALAAATGSATKAEMELWVYTGHQSAPHSNVRGSDPAGAGDFDFTAGWEGRPFDMPPHWGLRGVWWRSETFGYTLDFNHTKIYADDETLAASGFEMLEFTDGLNNLTAGIIRRWPDPSRAWTPYAGASAGVVIPHVEVRTGPGAPVTQEYQLVGPSVAVIFGATWRLTDRTALFGEYKGTWSRIDADLTGGGALETEVITNALNIGLAYRF